MVFIIYFYKKKVYNVVLVLQEIAEISEAIDIIEAILSLYIERSIMSNIIQIV